MTQSNPENKDFDSGAVEAGGPVKPGIYLEEKKSTIGTGNTAKEAEYRTFWVTLRIGDNTAEMVLLDDDFRPTGIRETFSHDVVLGPSWYFIAEGEKRYQRLKPYLDRLLAPPVPKAPAKPAAKRGGNWWEGGGGTSKDVFALDKKKTAPSPQKKGWWDK